MIGTHKANAMSQEETVASERLRDAFFWKLSVRTAFPHRYMNEEDVEEALEHDGMYLAIGIERQRAK